jgi:hypothetical protein
MSGWRTRRPWMRWLPALAWMAVIFTLSSISGLRVSDQAEVDRPIRGLAHMAAYGLLAGLLLYAICGRRRPRGRDVVVAVLLAIAYGVTDELHQAVVPGRTGRIDDLVIDALGALVGAAGAWLALTWLAARSEGPEAVDPSVRHPADR